jgi:transposase
MGQTDSKGKTNPERKRVRFGKEFKLEAVRLLELGQKPGTQLALELGIARNQLYKWQAQLGKMGKENAFRGPGRKPEEERSEIERLQAELKRVTEERDILKKAAAYFAKELP